MDLTDAAEDRISLGVARFLAGESITFQGVVFYATAEHVLHVDSFSEWSPERTSEAHAREKIVRSKTVLQELFGKSAALLAAVRHLRREFTVCHNYGMGSIVLANETDGRFQWVYRGEA